MKVNEKLCMKSMCVAFLCLLALPVSALASDYYVKTPANGGSDANPGISWDQAKATIQAAMDLATSTGDMVHVAAGTYNERVSFPEVNNIGLLGGYPAGGGTQAPWTNPTIIDGTGLTGSLVYIPGNFSTSYGYTGLAIDGFTIQNGTKNTYSGTGIESFSVDLNIKRCIIQNNTNTGGYVGGIYVAALMNESSLRILKIEECIIRNNTGPGMGGIVIDSIGYPTVELTNNLIYGNSATATDPFLYSVGGVGIGTGAQDLNSATLTNCTIADNTSAHGTAPVGGLAVNLDSHLDAVRVKNCIIWHPAIDDVYSYAIPENINISYSDIEDSGDTGTGVIHTDPAFASASDYHLTSSSGDCIDGGTSIGAPIVDLEGTARPQGNGYDMGAYEYVPQAIYGDELAVDFNTYGLWHYNGSSWTNLAGWNPEGMLEWDGGLAVAFPGYGVWNYDGSSWTSLAGWEPENGAEWNSGLALDFGTYGLWHYNGSDWTSLASWDPDDNMVVWAGGLAVDYGASYGLWNYDGESWSNLAGWNAEEMVEWDSHLAVDFGSDGLWSYDGTSWTSLAGWDPEGMLEWDGGLAVAFPGYGVWNYDGSSWTSLAGWEAQGAIAWNAGFAVDFGTYGVWYYNGFSWNGLAGWNPDEMTAWGAGLAVDFDIYGLWNYDGSLWTSLAVWNPDEMVGVDLY